MAGGKMAIYTGLIQQIKPTDNELAQVMSHEISHALASNAGDVKYSLNALLQFKPIPPSSDLSR